MAIDITAVGRKAELALHHALVVIHELKTQLAAAQARALAAEARVAELEAAWARVGEVIAAVGCECAEDHDEGDERCMGHRIEAAWALPPRRPTMDTSSKNTTDLPRLTIRRSDISDWYVIERAEHDGRVWLEPTDCGHVLMTSARFSDADVEGVSQQMVEIALAIRERRSVSFKRCAVRFEGEFAYFRSPRNSQREGTCTLEQADELAAAIDAMLGHATLPEGQ